MDLVNIGDKPLDGIFVFIGIILIVYVLFTRRRLKRLNERIPDSTKENRETETDVLGMEKPVPQGIEHFTSLDKVVKWKTVLLIVLMIIGLYLIFTQKHWKYDSKGPVNSTIEQAQPR